MKTAKRKLKNPSTKDLEIIEQEENQSFNYSKLDYLLLSEKEKNKIIQNKLNNGEIHFTEQDLFIIEEMTRVIENPNYIPYTRKSKNTEVSSLNFGDL